MFRVFAVAGLGLVAYALQAWVLAVVAGLMLLAIPTGFRASAAAAAFRVWVTEIRPKVHTVCPGGCGCCSDSKTTADKDEDDCLLLARIDVPVVPVPGGWQVSDVHPPSKDESRRPVLVSLRVQQEWLQVLSPRH